MLSIKYIESDHPLHWHLSIDGEPIMKALCEHALRPLADTLDKVRSMPHRQAMKTLSDAGYCDQVSSKLYLRLQSSSGKAN